MEERLEEIRKEREKGSHCFFKSSGYDKLELKHYNFFQAYKMHHQNVMECRNMCHW